MVTCVAGKEKISFIRLPQSQINCIDFVNPVFQYGVVAESLKTQLGMSVSIVLPIYFLSPPPHLSADTVNTES